jgi:hypothetical protein
MAARLFVHPAALQATEDTQSWHDDLSTAPGNDFGQGVAMAIDLICEHPGLYGDIGDGLYRAIVRRFPCQVFYGIGSDRIAFLAVYHSHADRHTLVDQARRCTRRRAAQSVARAGPAKPWCDFRAEDPICRHR